MKLLWDNSKFDAATLTATSEQSGWPAENLQATLRKKAWKTNGTGQATLQVDFGETVSCSALGLVEFNFIGGATVAVHAYSDAAYSEEIWAETFQVYQAIIGWGEGRWGLFGWGGFPSADELALLPRLTSLLCFSSSCTARYWELEFDNGYDEFYLGRVLLGEHWSAPPLKDGWTISLLDPSETEESLGGQRWTNTKDQYYRAVLDVARMTESQLLAEFKRISKYCGTRKDFVVQILGWTDKQASHTTFYGRFIASPEAESDE